MELRPRGNPKDRKERRQVYWLKEVGRGRQLRGGQYTHKCIDKDNSLWIRSAFPAFWIGLEMNVNPSTTHLQIRAQLQRSSAPESAPGYGSTPLNLELPSRKV